MKFSKWVVLLCIAMTTAYTAAVMSIAFGIEAFPPPELTAGVFGMYSIEFGAMAAIKRKELHVGSMEGDEDGEAQE